MVIRLEDRQVWRPPPVRIWDWHKENIRAPGHVSFDPGAFPWMEGFLDACSIIEHGHCAQQTKEATDDAIWKTLKPQTSAMRSSLVELPQRKDLRSCEMTRSARST